MRIPIYLLLLASSVHQASALVVISTNPNGGHRDVYPAKENQKLPLNQHLAAMFLPSGYPHTTPAGYMQFSIYSWIQDLSTQLRGVVATQRILQGVGVGVEGATALSALLNFLVRDGCGMFATLAFTAAAASRFKSDVKRWRLFADIMVDAGITIEVAAIQLPWFLPMVCLGNMCKAICGVAAGACGGAIQLHWAKGSDISDVAAKHGAQHTVTASIGLVVAAMFARSVSQVPASQLWGLFSLLTAVHLYANAQCMRLIGFTYFNTVRMDIALNEYWHNSTLSDPSTSAKHEPLLFTPTKRSPIEFGISFSKWKKHHPGEPVVIKMDSYCIHLVDKAIGVFLFPGITPRQQAKAYFHADLLRRQQMSGDLTGQIDGAATSLLTNTDCDVETAWKNFESQAEAAGWDLESTELQSQGYEVEFVQ